MRNKTHTFTKFKTAQSSSQRRQGVNRWLDTSEQNQAKDISAVSPANKVKAPKGHPRNDLMSKTVVVRLQDTSSKISSIDEHVTWSINRRGNLGHSWYNTGNVLGASRQTPACLSHEEKQKCSQDCVWL